MFLESLFGLAATDRYSPSSDFWYSGFGSKTLAGVSVDETTALNYSACWAATRLLSGTGACLPFNLYRRLPGGGSEIALNHPLQTLLHDAPNERMSAVMWRSAGISQQVNWGNTYAEIERNRLGQIVALHPIHASRVRLYEDTSHRLWYGVKSNNGHEEPFDYDEIFHVPSMMSDDGMRGKGVIRHARETVGAGLAKQKYGATFFGNGAKPGLIVKHPGRPTQEARTNFRREWNEIHQGPENAHNIALLAEGMDIKEISATNQDSQFIESQQWDIEEIARWYGVPPHMLQHLLRATFSNIEHMGIEFTKYSLIPWLKIWEQEVWRKLLAPEERKQYYAKHVVDALERGDLASRTAAMVQEVFNGKRTINEWRQLDDLNPIGPAGDVHWVQQAMVPLEVAAKGPQKPEPPKPAEPKEPADEPQEEPAEDENALAVQAAAADVLTEIVGVMLQREAKEALQAAKKPQQFLGWLDAFYAEHAQRMQRALALPLRAWLLACRDRRDTIEMLRPAIERHVAESRNLLLSASEVSPEQFAASVAACVESWGDRAGQFHKNGVAA